MRSKLGVQVLGSVEGHAKPVSCAVPVQETDQQGALEANEWQAGSGPKSPNSEGKAHSPSSPQAITWAVLLYQCLSSAGLGQGGHTAVHDKLRSFLTRPLILVTVLALMLLVCWIANPRQVTPLLVL